VPPSWLLQFAVRLPDDQPHLSRRRNPVRTHVHLVAIKISIIGIADTLVEAERSPWTNFNLTKNINRVSDIGIEVTHVVTHYRQLLQMLVISRRLTYIQVGLPCADWAGD
jgi:hypothetical protein